MQRHIPEMKWWSIAMAFAVSAMVHVAGEPAMQWLGVAFCAIGCLRVWVMRGRVNRLLRAGQVMQGEAEAL